MDFLNLLGTPAGTGITWGAAVGLLGVGIAVASKTWLDRDLMPARFTAGRELRREAKAQVRALKTGQGHVPAGMPGAGQFTSVRKADASIDLTND